MEQDNTKRILDFIIRYCVNYPGAFPTTREIQDGLEIKSTSTVAYHLQKLVDLGELAQIEGRHGRYFVPDGSFAPPPHWRSEEAKGTIAWAVETLRRERRDYSEG